MNNLLQNIIVRTPVLQYRSVEMNIFLKPENLQPFGSYKIRGVKSAIEFAPLPTLRKGISCASAGNMAQVVAYWARVHGLPCRVFVPDSAPQIKKQALQHLGAEIFELPFHQVWELVRNPPHHTELYDGLFMHPVFTSGLLEGYGTIADELLADRAGLDAVVVPFGVGGLILGIARRLKELNPNVKIFACEPETAAPLSVSLQSGRASQVERKPSFVDAIGTPEVIPTVFNELKNLVSGSIVVTLEEVRIAMKELVVTHKLVCEGAAAAGLAAAKKLGAKNPHLKIACVLTGGNTNEIIMK